MYRWLTMYSGARGLLLKWGVYMNCVPTRQQQQHNGRRWSAPFAGIMGGPPNVASPPMPGPRPTALKEGPETVGSTKACGLYLVDPAVEAIGAPLLVVAKGSPSPKTDDITEASGLTSPGDCTRCWESIAMGTRPIEAIIAWFCAAAFFEPKRP